MDADGNEQILALVSPGRLHRRTVFAPFAHHDVVALTESRLCTFAKRDIERAIEDYPALARALLRRSQADLLATRTLLELTGHASAEARPRRSAARLRRRRQRQLLPPGRTFLTCR